MPRSSLAAGSGTQPSLFDPVEPPRAPFQPKSRTSRAAAVGAAQHRHEKRDRVYRAIASAGAEGRTCSELAYQLGVEPHWLTSSIDKLLELGIIADSGRERTNPRSGKAQRVLVATR